MHSEYCNKKVNMRICLKPRWPSIEGNFIHQLCKYIYQVYISMRIIYLIDVLGVY